MTSPASGPSALLAELAYLLHDWEQQGLIGNGWLQRAEPDLVAAAKRWAARGYSSDLMTARARRVLHSLVPLTYESFLEAAETLQRLDGWHSSLGLGAGRDSTLEDEHEQALRRLMVDGTGYNPPEGFGTVIPAAAIHSGRRPAKPGLVGQLLHFTAYLPAQIAAGDPDDPSAASTRQVDLRYVARSTRSGDPRGPVDERPLVAIAPTLQDQADAVLDHETTPGRYRVRVVYDPSRLGQIVAKAVASGAHMLFMPEVAIDAGQVRALASAIRKAASEHRRATGSLPQLRFVAVGLAHSSGATGNNSIVVLDIEGKQVLEQDKLCRWNLKPHHQRMYGVDPECTDGAPDLAEDIPGGSRIWIADLEHLGRFLTLICADMDYDKPGDWLIRNVSLDWLHAPIMDRSIGWHFDGSGGLQPWIVERAQRAAANGVPRVVVTNSVLLTLKLNEHNAALVPPSHPVLETCAIAFMLDASEGACSFKQLEATLPCGEPIVEVVRWLDGFEPFPPVA